MQLFGPVSHVVRFPGGSSVRAAPLVDPLVVIADLTAWLGPGSKIDTNLIYNMGCLNVSDVLKP